MWNRPWGYAEGYTVCAGLFMTGIILQISIGKIDADIYRYPINLIAGISFLLVLIILHLYSRKSYFLKWFSGLEASITSLTSLLVMILIMGLTRQISPAVDLSSTGGFARVGFMQMTVSWPFVILFIYFLFVLGLVLLRRLRCFRWKDTGFVLNHAGLFIALLAAILGSGDLQRLRMTVPLETLEWRATDEKQEMVELPFALELHFFTIDEYPPKLLLLDNETGKALPENQPDNVLVEEIPSKGRLTDWEVEVTDFIPMAACFITQDTVTFVDFHSVGATSAVYVKAFHKVTQAAKEGWISCGNHMFPYVSLPLNETESLIMPMREPKQFASEVTVYTQKGEVREAVIEVNKPLSVDGWKVYQLSYDENMGKWSRVSVFELVKDPWMPLVYAGIWMMIAGSVFLFITAPTKKK